MINRSEISIGATVDIVLKADQRSGKLTRGEVKRLLTKSASHPPTESRLCLKMVRLVE